MCVWHSVILPQTIQYANIIISRHSRKSGIEIIRDIKASISHKTFFTLKRQHIDSTQGDIYNILRFNYKKTALPKSANSRTTKLPRVREPQPRVESCKTVGATRVEEVQEEIRPPIQTERWKLQLSTHIYPTLLKVLSVKSIIVSEIVNTMDIPNHNRVYPL